MNVTKQKVTHTPGPWRVVEVNEGVLAIESPDNGTFCRPANINGDASDSIYGPIIKANARLIAAAPDLLAALDKCRGKVFEPKPNATYSIELSGTDLIAIRAAIAKAKGQ